MGVEAVIADLDGTIWDSRPWCANLVADISNLTVAEATEELERIPLPRLIDSLPGIGRAGFRRLMLSRISDLQLYPGVQESLEILDQLGTGLAVATSLPAWIAEPMLEGTGLRQLVGPVATASAPFRKPDPRIVDQLLGGLGADPSVSVVIGDDERDAEMASRAGVPFIWAAYGYGTKPDLPIYMEAHSFSEILRL